MADGLTTNLCCLALAVWLTGVFQLRKVLPFFASASVAAIKVVIPLVYFSWFYDATWNFIDDITYFTQASKLIEEGFHPITLFFHKEQLGNLFIVSGGPHILYLWWNLLSEYFVGPFYYAPVFFNVALTFVAARMMFRLALLAGFVKNYAQCLAIFFLLHPDVLVWSSLVNLKDVLLLTLTTAFFTLLIDLNKNRTFAKVAKLATVFFLFLWIRFYIPLLILAVVGIWYVIPYLIAVKSALCRKSILHKLYVTNPGVVALTAIAFMLITLGVMRLLVPGEMHFLLAFVLTVCCIYLILHFQRYLIWWHVAIYCVSLNFFWSRPQIVESINCLFILVCITPVRMACNDWMSQIRLSVRKARKPLLIVCSFAFSVIIIKVIGVAMILDSVRRLAFSPLALVVGIAKMLLTPQPWSIDATYSFLTLPAIFHWFLLVPAVFSGISLWRKSPELKLLVLYMLICLLLYGSYEELQGPRQRVQFTFIIAWLQFDFLWRLARMRSRISIADLSRGSANYQIK